MKRPLAWLVDKLWKDAIILRRESRSSTYYSFIPFFSDRKSTVEYSKIKWFETIQENSILIACP